ncbi:recombinase family protein [Novosphingobium sp.]|uniref:recombinase family protein n=1 Tax=Novosphingobium sp. TaxID=1874826 RepID=UPI003BACE50F
MKKIRCAIYTRKSSEDGLEQDFNSLDAQREACAAYILSQTSEGWSQIPDRYDDGGISGGTLGRPALQRLLADVAAGQVDIIVVYKIDRLTRSLLDFAKLVEAFDKVGTSFVSITQSFNTTTSMGRLTLNMLLSFAQFEREVIAERVRDKIAASKAKGMWMGGTPPLGYRPDGRSLAVVEEEADLVRAIYSRYLEIGNVRLLLAKLARDGIRSPQRETANGKSFGGIPFSRGQLYRLLSNPIYLGKIEHKGQHHAALHHPIVDQAMWDEVQRRLADNVKGHRSGVRSISPSPLAGRIVDGDNQPLMATHACKGKVRYRYYVSAATHLDAAKGMRIPAKELEGAVIARLRDALADPLSLAVNMGLPIEVDTMTGLHDRAAEAAASVNGKALFGLIEKVKVDSERIEFSCPAPAIANLLGLAVGKGTASLTFDFPVRLSRTGKMVRLIEPNGAAAAQMPNEPLVRLIARAHRWWDELCKGEIDVTRYAAQEKVPPSYMLRVLRLAFLSPQVIDAIIGGRARADLGCTNLTLTEDISPHWQEQAAALLPT